MPTTLVPPSAGDILRHAYNLLDEWGLTKGRLVDSNGRMCESGALAVASGAYAHRYDWRIGYYAGYLGDEWPAGGEATTALMHVGGGSGHNDMTTTTKPAALAKLAEAAAYADKQGW